MLTVWVPILTSDSRGAWRPARTPGRQFWDGDRVAARWLADQNVGGLGYAGIVWDAWFLFGADATWNDRPTGLVGSGTTVVDTSSRLRAALASV